MRLSNAFLRPLCPINWQITVTRFYSHKAKFIPSTIKADAEIIIPKGLRENAFKYTPENLFYEEIQQQFDLPPTVEQVQHLAEERKWEMKKMSQKMYFKTIEKKYFKETKPAEPNLLTWDMKEHLCNLHSSDPELWDPVALSRAFPVSPTAIMKLLKSQRKLLTPEKLKEHDLKVVQNWKNLTGNKLGNYGLLEKIINQRILTMRNENRLPIPSKTHDETTSIFKDVIFTGTDDPTVDEIRGAVNLPRRTLTKWRKSRPTFKDIITQFEELKRQSKPSSSTGGPEEGRPEKKRLPRDVADTPADTPAGGVSVRPLSDVSIRPRKHRTHNALRDFRTKVTLEEYKQLKNL